MTVAEFFPRLRCYLLGHKSVIGYSMDDQPVLELCIRCGRVLALDGFNDAVDSMMEDEDTWTKSV